MSKRTLVAGAILALGLLCSGIASAAPTPEQKCQSGKSKAAGKYSACRQNAEAKLVTTGDGVKYGETITKCETKFASTWLKRETAAADNGVSCPDSPLLGTQFKTVIDAHSSNIKTGLAGSGLAWCGNTVKDGSESCDGSDLGGKSCTDFGFASGTLACTVSCQLDTNGCNPVVCGNGTIDAGEECDQDNLNGQTCVGLGFDYGTLTCSAGCVLNDIGCYTPRFTDNSDGTVTDHQTGLMWEKKADFDAVPVVCPDAATCPDPHDADNLYTFSFDSPLGPPGTAYTVFLAQLNASLGFAGHTDWRLPTQEELQRIVDYADLSSPVVNSVFDTACTGSCTVTTCSCAAADDRYWSSSTTALSVGNAWFVDFSWGDVGHDTKDTDYHARAVRTAP